MAQKFKIGDNVWYTCDGMLVDRTDPDYRGESELRREGVIVGFHCVNVPDVLAIVHLRHPCGLWVEGRTEYITMVLVHVDHLRKVSAPQLMNYYDQTD